MNGTPDARIVEWFSFGVEPSRVNYALVEFRSGKAGYLGRLAGSGRVERAGVIHSARQNGGPKLRRKRQEIIELNAVKMRKALVPVVRVPLHYPDFVLDPALCLEGASTGDVEDLAQVVIILF